MALYQFHYDSTGKLIKTVKLDPNKYKADYSSGTLKIIEIEQPKNEKKPLVMINRATGEKRIIRPAIIGGFNQGNLNNTNKTIIKQTKTLATPIQTTTLNPQQQLNTLIQNIQNKQQTPIIQTNPFISSIPLTSQQQKKITTTQPNNTNNIKKIEKSNDAKTKSNNKNQLIEDLKKINDKKITDYDLINKKIYEDNIKQELPKLQKFDYEFYKSLNIPENKNLAKRIIDDYFMFVPRTGAKLIYTSGYIIKNIVEQTTNNIKKHEKFLIGNLKNTTILNLDINNNIKLLKINDNNKKHITNNIIEKIKKKNNENFNNLIENIASDIKIISNKYVDNIEQRNEQIKELEEIIWENPKAKVPLYFNNIDTGKEVSAKKMLSLLKNTTLNNPYPLKDKDIQKFIMLKTASTVAGHSKIANNIINAAAISNIAYNVYEDPSLENIIYQTTPYISYAIITNKGNIIGHTKDFLGKKMHNIIEIADTFPKELREVGSEKLKTDEILTGKTKAITGYSGSELPNISEPKYAKAEGLEGYFGTKGYEIDGETMYRTGDIFVKAERNPMYWKNQLGKWLYDTGNNTLGDVWVKQNNLNKSFIKGNWADGTPKVEVKNIKNWLGRNEGYIIGEYDIKTSNKNNIKDYYEEIINALNEIEKPIATEAPKTIRNYTQPEREIFIGANDKIMDNYMKVKIGETVSGKPISAIVDTRNENALNAIKDIQTKFKGNINYDNKNIYYQKELAQTALDKWNLMLENKITENIIDNSAQKHIQKVIDYGKILLKENNMYNKENLNYLNAFATVHDLPFKENVKNYDWAKTLADGIENKLYDFVPDVAKLTPQQKSILANTVRYDEIPPLNWTNVKNNKRFDKTIEGIFIELNDLQKILINADRLARFGEYADPNMIYKISGKDIKMENAIKIASLKNPINTKNNTNIFQNLTPNNSKLKNTSQFMDKYYNYDLPKLKNTLYYFNLKENKKEYDNNQKYTDEYYNYINQKKINDLIYDYILNHKKNNKNEINTYIPKEPNKNNYTPTTTTQPYEPNPIPTIITPPPYKPNPIPTYKPNPIPTYEPNPIPKKTPKKNTKINKIITSNDNKKYKENEYYYLTIGTNKYQREIPITITTNNDAKKLLAAMIDEGKEYEGYIKKEIGLPKYPITKGVVNYKKSDLDKKFTQYGNKLIELKKYRSDSKTEKKGNYNIMKLLKKRKGF